MAGRFSSRPRSAGPTKRALNNENASFIVSANFQTLAPRGERLQHQLKDSRIRPTIVAITRKKVTIGFVKIANESRICRGFIWHLRLAVTGSRDALRLDRQKAH